MNTKQLARTSIAIAALFISAISARMAHAQGTGPIGPIAPIQTRQMPVPAARGPVDIGPAPSQVRADTHTLASIETLGVGSLGVLTSLLDPSFRFAQSANTGTATTAGSGNSAMTSLGMNLAFNRGWTRSHLAGFYRGAQVLSYPDSTSNAAYHNVGIAEEYQANRWVFRVREDLLSSPEAALAGVDIGGILLSGGNGMLGSLQPAAGAGDTILTQPTRRLRSTTSGEINYYLSRRSILTAASSYTSLTFKNASFIDSHRISGRAGYDYLLSPKNVIGLMYDYSRTDFSITSTRLRTDSVQVAFGRRLTGRLAFQAMGGPQQVTLGTGNRQLTWTVSNNIYYQTRRSQYSLSYSRTSSDGSGVFAGTSADVVRANVHHSLSQWWSASTAAGYSFNRALAPANGIVNRSGAWNGTVNLERDMGRHFHLSLNYGFQTQNSGSGACPAAGCGPTAFRQAAGITLDWHPLSMGAR